MCRPTRLLLSSMVVCIITCLAMVFGGLASAKPVEIEFFVSQVWGVIANESYQRIADMFNQSQDKVHVNIVIATGSFEEKVLTRIAAGVAPDVINSNAFGDLVPQGVIQPLTKFAQRDNLIKDLIPPAVAATTWDGELMMLPQVAQPFVIYYNPSLFANAGISNPYQMYQQGKWTWDTVSSSARKISSDVDADGKLDVWGMGVPITMQQRTSLWVLQAGGQYFDRWVNPTKATYDSPKVAQALTFLNELVQNQAMPIEGATSNQVNQKFYAGKAGFMIEGPWQNGFIRGANFNDWDLAPVAKGPVNAGTIMQVDGLQMLKATQHPEEAWQWMKFLVANEKAFDEFTTATGRPPVMLKGLQTYLKDIVKNGQPTHPDAYANAMMNPIIGPCIPVVANVTAIGKVFGTEIQKFLKNQQSLQVTLQKINESATLTLQQNLANAKKP